MSALYLLDTNILVHFVRADAVWNRIQLQYSLLTSNPTPAICVVSEGEIRSLSLQWNRQSQRCAQMEFILAHLIRHTIDQRPVYDAYAIIEAYTRGIGRPMGKNDLWIAAMANYMGARLLTSDRDFDHLDPMFLQVDWIDPRSTQGSP